MNDKMNKRVAPTRKNEKILPRRCAGVGGGEGMRKIFLLLLIGTILNFVSCKKQKFYIKISNATSRGTVYFGINTSSINEMLKVSPGEEKIYGEYEEGGYTFTLYVDDPDLGTGIIAKDEGFYLDCNKNLRVKDGYYEGNYDYEWECE